MPPHRVQIRSLDKPSAVPKPDHGLCSISLYNATLEGASESIDDQYAVCINFRFAQTLISPNFGSHTEGN